MNQVKAWLRAVRATAAYKACKPVLVISYFIAIIGLCPTGIGIILTILSIAYMTAYAAHKGWIKEFFDDTI